MKPQNSYLILKPFKEEAYKEVGSAGIVVMNDGLKDRDVTGWARIHATCEGSKYEVGKTVLYSKFIPCPFRFEEIDYLFIKESDVICIV